MSEDPPKRESAARRRIRAIRNLGIMAHIDAGKTTVTERLLFVAGRTHKMGEVHEGQAVMDWMELERERGITITSAVTSFGWRGHDLHLIDTPGHVDFTIEVERSLRVLDGAVAVFDAAHGVEPQSETVWRQADRYHVPRIAFANKMDRVGADFAATLASLRARFPGKVIAPVQRPTGVESAFTGFEDLLARRRLHFTDPEDPRAFAAEEGLSPEGEDDRRRLVEAVADLDDRVAELVLGDREVDEASLRAAVRRATLAGRLVPLLCGSALRNKGIPQLLDAVCDYLPSPLEVPAPTAAHPGSGAEEAPGADEQARLLALAFKVSLLDEKRRFVFLRLYAGRIAEGDEVWNATLGKPERVARVLLMHAAQKTRVPAVGAGQICAVLGLRETRTGDTLSDRDHPLVLEPISGYDPVISQSIEPATQGEREALLEALARVADEDPTFRFGEDKDTGQLLISGMGELHLEVAAERLRREFRLGVRTGRPQVLMRETLTAEAEAESTFERALEEDRIFAMVAVRVGPRPRGEGFRFEIAPEVAALAFMRPEVREFVLQGAREAAEAGALEGHPLQDVAVTLTAASWREGHSKPFAYKIATADAVRAAAARAKPVLLEPFARVEVVLPAEHLGDVIASLDRRRGTILDVAEGGLAEKTVTSEAPLRRMFGYATELRSLTRGRAVFTLRFERYDVAG
ncbi:MAG TPA: elongation factor G [Anaeromyxobacteraceae bacterium]|nr:elongation factor G [Anaeromyxobacteraceae bacterium]